MRIIKFLVTCLLVAMPLSMGFAYGADYSFKGASSAGYYKSTLYEDVFGSEYNYGGVNLADYYRPVELPGYHAAGGPASIAHNVTVSNSNVTSAYQYNGSAEYTYSAPYSFTSANSLTRSDGSIGTLKIPSLGITMKAYEGATDSSMAKGVGHFSQTSAWDGNIGLSGHNRGAKYNIGTISNLKIGDKITYTTSLGSRTYSVSFVGQISSTDWSYLDATSDNRITLITCLADKPSLRICVQGKEVK